MGKQKHDIGYQKRLNIQTRPASANRSARAAWRNLAKEFGYGNFHTGAAAK